MARMSRRCDRAQDDRQAGGYKARLRASASDQGSRPAGTCQAGHEGSGSRRCVEAYAHRRQDLPPSGRVGTSSSEARRPSDCRSKGTERPTSTMFVSRLSHRISSSEIGISRGLRLLGSQPSSDGSSSSTGSVGQIKICLRSRSTWSHVSASASPQRAPVFARNTRRGTRSGDFAKHAVNSAWTSFSVQTFGRRVPAVMKFILRVRTASPRSSRAKLRTRRSTRSSLLIETFFRPAARRAWTEQARSNWQVRRRNGPCRAARSAHGTMQRRSLVSRCARTHTAAFADHCARVKWASTPSRRSQGASVAVTA